MTVSIGWVPLFFVSLDAVLLLLRLKAMVARKVQVSGRENSEGQRLVDNSESYTLKFFICRNPDVR